MSNQLELSSQRRRENQKLLYFITRFSAGCFLLLSGKQKRIIFAINGSGIPIKNQGQNFLPKHFAICPAIKGMISGIKSSGNAKRISM
jgi:hypothetical protein